MTVPLALADFSWNRRDTDQSFAVVLALDLNGKPRLAERVRDSQIALQYADRNPTLEDAWAFLQAARTLDRCRPWEGPTGMDTLIVSFARQIGLRIACAATALLIGDVHCIEFGVSRMFVAIPQADGGEL